LLAVALAVFAAPASANHNGAAVTSVAINPPNDTAAAGTCNPYEVTVMAGAAVAENTAVRAIVQESAGTNNGTGNSTPPAGSGPANSPTTDVDFCTVASPGTAPAGGQPATPANVNDTGAAGAGDTATYTTDANGKVVIGIISNAAGVAQLQVFVDQGTNPGGTPNPGVNNGTFDTGEPTAYATKQFTQGAGAGNENVKCVDASPEIAGNFVGETHTVLVNVYNAVDADADPTNGCQGGDPLTGVTPSAQVTTSSNVAHTGDALTCNATGNNGPSTCTYSEATVGQDVIRVWVNNTSTTAPAARTPSSTFQADEFSDDVQKNWTTSTTTNTIDLTCGVVGQTTANGGRTSAEDCVDPTTDTNEVFQAVVKDAAGAAAPT